MNKKKINKIISYAISGIYILNSTPVFAESNLNEDISITAPSDNYESENTNYNLSNENFDVIEDESKGEVKDVSNFMEDDNTESNVTVEDNSIDKEEDTVTDYDALEKDDYILNENVVDVEISNEELLENNIVASENTVIGDESHNERNLSVTNKVVTNIIDEVVFADENLHKKINEALKRGSVTTPVTVADMQTLSGNLSLSSSNIEDLSGIEYAENITTITLSDNNIKSLEPLTHLSNLTAITIQNNGSPISAAEINSLSNLNKLQSIIAKIDDANGTLMMEDKDSFPALAQVVLTGSNIGNIKIANKEKLQYMNLSNVNTKNVNIENIDSLRQIDSQGIVAENITLNNNGVVSYYLSNGNFNNLSILNCNQLQMLDLSNSKSQSIYCENLQSLSRVSAIQVNSSSFILNNTKMGSISLTGSNINEITLTNLSGSFICEINNVTADTLSIDNIGATTLSLDNSNIKNISIKAMPSLQQITANYLITTVLDFSEINSLTSLQLRYANLEELILVGIKNLNYIYLDNAELKEVLLENLPQCTYFSGGNLKGSTNVNVLNSPSIRTFYLKGATLNNVLLENSCNNVDITMEDVIGNSLNSYGCSLNAIVLDGSNLKNVDIDANGTLSKNLFFRNGVSETFSVVNAPLGTIASLDGTSFKNLKLDGFGNTVGLNLSSSGLETLDLKGLDSLKSIDISNNKLTNIDALKNISSLETVIASNNEIEDISPVTSSLGITNLDFSNNKISDIESLKVLSLLEDINLENNNISDISVLSNCALLTNDKINVLNQNIKLDTVYSKSGEVKIKYPLIKDIDNSIVPIASVSNGGTYDNNNIIWNMNVNDGLYTENISFESINGNFSVNSSQDIVIDDTNPELNISLDNSNFTNKDVNILVNSSDESGIAKIYLPDGSYIESDKASFLVKENGTYSFVSEDIVGNITEKTVVISNIDKDKPVINIEKTEDNNNKVIVNISADDYISGIKNIILPDGTVIEASNTTITFDKNGEYIVVVEDNAGNISTETIKITEIKTPETNNSDKIEGNIPSTGGISGILSTAFIASILSGLYIIKRKSKK